MNENTNSICLILNIIYVDRPCPARPQAMVRVRVSVNRVIGVSNLGDESGINGRDKPKGKIGNVASVAMTFGTHLEVTSTRVL